MDVEGSVVGNMEVQPSLRQETRMKFLACWSAVFVAFTGTWPYGFSAGSINAAYAPTVAYINKTYSERKNAVVHQELVNLVWVIIVIAFPFGGIFGSFFTGPIISRFGRLKGLIFCHIAFIVLGCFLALSKLFQSPEVIVLCRFGVGIFVSANTGICVMYVIEVSPRHARGIFGAMISLAINTAVLLSNVMGLPQVLGNENTWNILLALVGGASVLFLLLVRTLSDCPREVFIEKGETERARDVLNKLNGSQVEVDHIIDELTEEKTYFASHPRIGIIQIMRSPDTRLALLVALLLAASQQITGLSCVAFNMNEIFLKAGISVNHVHYASLVVFGLTVAIHGITIPLIERKGRKSLLLYGYGIQGTSLIILAVTIELQHLSNVLAYISVVAAAGFWMGFSVGPGPVTLVVVGELFEQASRSAGVSLSSAALWFGMSLTAFAAPYLLESIRGYTFVIFGVLSYLAWGFIFYKVPETKNQPFTEIQGLLAKHSHSQNAANIAETEFNNPSAA